MKNRDTFNIWHEQKAALNEIEKPPFFHEREVWFCSLGINIGSEQDGKGEKFLRPIVVLRKFNNEVLWAIPLTKTPKKSSPYYFTFSFVENRISTAILSQLRLIDARRLIYRIGQVNEKDFVSIKRKLKALLL